MLTGSKILEEVESGGIQIKPFDKRQLNPNSYNVRLGNKLKVYVNEVLDFEKDNPSREMTIPEEGLILQPGELYIGNIIERIATDKYISAVDGRSSVGRLGILIHATAGFGDIGFDGNYTLEIFCIKPVRIYPNMLIGQIYFSEPYGPVDFLYRGRYQGQSEPTTSRSQLKGSQLGNDYYYKG
ncbi:MAG: dCTP deaminase [Treponema sp.]|nr:dCTP deaminase [Treponema sp.]